MKKDILKLGVLVALAAASCTMKDNFQNQQLTEQELTITATREGDEAQTRTYRNDADGSIWWVPGDAISLFYGSGTNGGSKFTSVNTTDTIKVTNFTGVITAITGGGEIAVGQTYFWGLYPYQEDASCDGTSVTMTLPKEQTAVPGTFATNTFPSIGRSQGLIMGFYNICSGMKFSVTKEGIKKVTLKSRNGEHITGKAKVKFENGVPVAEIIDGSDEVVLEAPAGEYFEVGKYYFIVMFPTTFTNGFTVKLETFTEEATVEKMGSLTARRSNFGKLLDIDENATYTHKPDAIPSPEAVDLGLSVKWANYNVGATKPDEYGDYFAWGEIKPYYRHIDDIFYNFSFNQQGYDWDIYQWISLGQEYTNIKRYCPSILTGIDRWTGPGNPDDKTEFADYNYADDAARANWQGEWRTPSEAEWSELLNDCSWVWEENYKGTGINGYLVTSTKPGYTDQSIFLPASGWFRRTAMYSQNSYGQYWSSSLYISRPDNAWCLTFSSGFGASMQYSVRPGGFSVRPVLGVPVLVSSVHLNCYSISLYEGDSFNLSATVSPSGIENQTVTWASSDPSVVSVNSGHLVAITEGAATITVSRDGNEATCEVYVFRNVTAPEAVDLGLNVKWASCNVGATKPEEYGDYFAWGETEPYYQPGYAQSENPVWKSGKEAGYDLQSYRWCNGSTNTLTRYCPSGETGYWDGSGSPDGKTQFADYNYADDAARANWQGKWRTPTTAECSELRSKCEWSKTSLCGINGYVVTSKVNGKKIFLPAAGSRSQKGLNRIGSGFCYWTSTISSDPPSYALSVDDLSDGIRRYYGCSVRPVTE